MTVAETLQTDIQIPFTSAATHHLNITTNGVKLLIKPQDQPLWVDGTSIYKRPPAPDIDIQGDEAHIKQEYVRSELTNMFRVASDSPVLDLHLSQTQPYNLSVDSLGDITELDLGGLPLQHVVIVQRMGQGVLHFSAPHPNRLAWIEIDGQAARMEITQLGNARFDKMTLKGFTTTYKLHWGILPANDSLLELQTREAPTTLFLPPQMAVKIRAMEGSLDTQNTEFTADDGFIEQQGEYWTQAALEGNSPVLTVLVAQKSPLAVHIQ